MSEPTATYDPFPVSGTAPATHATTPTDGSWPERSGTGRHRHLTLAAETRPTPADGAVDTAIGTLHAVIDQLAATDDDTLTDEQLRARLEAVRRPIARMDALRARWAATLERRTIAAAPPERKGAAQQSARRELSRGQRLSPSQTKSTVDAGRTAQAHPATGRAFTDGQLSADHVRIIGECLRHTPYERREELEARLLELAADRDPVTFGRLARQLLAEHCPDDTAQLENTRRTRRRLRATDTPDGGFAFSGLLYGTAAEEARVAFQAFRRPDAKDEHRTPEQRAADAFEQLCGAALRSGDAPTQHGIRPHVIVIINAEDLAAATTATAATTTAGRYALSGQPATTQELSPLLSDCSLTRIALDATGIPTTASREVRTVPRGLFRILLVRDGGCRWPGCDAPPAWCDVAHARTRYTDDGRLDPSNAVLLCRRHHRRFDQQGWDAHAEGATIHFIHPTNPSMTSAPDHASHHPPPRPPPGTPPDERADNQPDDPAVRPHPSNDPSGHPAHPDATSAPPPRTHPGPPPGPSTLPDAQRERSDPTPRMQLFPDDPPEPEPGATAQ